LAQRVEIEGNNTPTLRPGNRVLNLDFSILDEFTDRTGLLATIFVRMNDD
jgi:methyl-accepting chemotaxis protein